MHHQKTQEPFIFLLLRELLGQEESQSGNEAESVTPREFYLGMTLIAVAFLLTSWAFGALPF